MFYNSEWLVKPRFCSISVVLLFCFYSVSLGYCAGGFKSGTVKLGITQSCLQKEQNVSFERLKYILFRTM